MYCLPKHYDAYSWITENQQLSIVLIIFIAILLAFPYLPNLRNSMVYQQHKILQTWRVHKIKPIWWDLAEYAEYCVESTRKTAAKNLAVTGPEEKYID